MKNWLDHVVEFQREWHPDGFISRPVTRREQLVTDVLPLALWVLVLAVVGGLTYLGTR